MNYYPEGYQFLKVYTDKGKPLVKLFASWAGGYTGGDTWRINSGCTMIQETENEYIVHGFSGSYYILGKSFNMLTNYNKRVLDDMLEELKAYGHKAQLISLEEARALVGA